MPIRDISGSLRSSSIAQAYLQLTRVLSTDQSVLRLELAPEKAAKANQWAALFGPPMTWKLGRFKEFVREEIIISTAINPVNFAFCRLP